MLHGFTSTIFNVMPCHTKTANVKLHMPNSTMQDFWVMEFSAFYCFYNYMNVHMTAEKNH